MRRLRVLTFNVENVEGDDRRTKAINQELRRIEPDLVSFQEVISRPDRNQLDELLAGTELHGTHQSDAMSYTPPFADRFGGTAVATRGRTPRWKCLTCGWPAQPMCPGARWP